MRIPLKARYQRAWTDIKRKLPFIKYPVLTNEGEALLMHLRNLYAGNEAYSPLALQLVNEVTSRISCSEKEAVQSIYLHFYTIGLIDEIELAKLELI